MDWRDLLISLFVYVCQKYKEELWLYCQRMSNNRKKQDFPDEEIITLYLSGIIQTVRKSGKFTSMLRPVSLTGFLICHRMLHLLTGSTGLKVYSGH